MVTINATWTNLKPHFAVVASWTTKDMKKLPFISGGGLEGKYVFSNFHFHWGSDDSKGSEHTFDGDRLVRHIGVGGASGKAQFVSQYISRSKKA